MTFVDHLSTFGPADWPGAVETLAPQIHPVDLDATRIWFAFYPLEVHLAVATAEDPAAAARKLGLMGTWRLADQVDTSHRFLYGHRYWPQVKRAILATAAEASWPDRLPPLVERVADHASRTCAVDRDQLIGIVLAGLMTLRCAGLDAFTASDGRVHLAPDAHARSIRQIRRARSLQRSQGLFGFLRGGRKTHRMTFDENAPEATFDVIAGQDIATGAQSDKRDYRSRDSRCIPNEGPIPVECRAASCGTCWVGVIAGADRLSPIDPSDEGKRLGVFGYTQPASSQGAPLIRLACQARPSGDVTFVIPPWNGIIGKLKKTT